MKKGNKRIVAIIGYAIMAAYGWVTDDYTAVGVMMLLNVIGYIEGCLSMAEN